LNCNSLVHFLDTILCMDGRLRVNLHVLKDINFKTIFLSFIAYKNLILRPGMMRQPSLLVGQCRIHCYNCIVFLHVIFFGQFQLFGMSARQKDCVADENPV